MFARWRLPAVLCARTALGTINHSLLSIEALRARGVPILGVAFIGDANPDSEATIARLGRVRRLGRLPWLDAVDADSLAAAFADNFDPADFAQAGA
jgi:dethiobiotin synthetase